MNKSYSGIIILFIVGLMVFTGCNNINLPSVINSKNESGSLPAQSIFNIMKEQSLTELYFDDTNYSISEMFISFCTELNAIYYDEKFVNAVNEKEKYIPKAIKIICDKNKNEYGWLKLLDSSGVLSGEFNRIKSTSIPDQYKLYSNNDDLDFLIIIKDNRVNKIINEGMVFLNIDVPMDDYINNLYLMGKYKDKNGGIYEFTKDKQAVWPNRSFNYSLFNWDYTECWDIWEDCNPILIINKDTLETTEQYFGYKIIDGKIYIYEIIAGEPIGYYIKENPMLILEKIAD